MAMLMQSISRREVQLVDEGDRGGGVQAGLRSSVMVLMQAVASCVLELAPSS